MKIILLKYKENIEKEWGKDFFGKNWRNSEITKSFYDILDQNSYIYSVSKPNLKDSEL